MFRLRTLAVLGLQSISLAQALLFVVLKNNFTRVALASGTTPEVGHESFKAQLFLRIVEKHCTDCDSTILGIERKIIYLMLAETLIVAQLLSCLVSPMITA